MELAIMYQYNKPSLRFKYEIKNDDLVLSIGINILNMTFL